VPATTGASKPQIGPAMEGRIARRYAHQRGSAPQRRAFVTQAGQLTAELPDGAAVLEVAPGPGYLAIEMARSGRLRVTGLDASRTFVELATEAAGREGVDVDFRHGDAAELPFAEGSFDLVVTQAAFKNFSRPAQAIAEFHRVLRPGGVAIIEDMSGQATGKQISKEVKGMGLGWASAATTRAILTWLRRRAHSPSEFEQLVEQSPFRSGLIGTHGISVHVRLTKLDPSPSGG
jgi:ubiquinone/menaquinone biosynthesis C-methylase UbiE